VSDGGLRDAVFSAVSRKWFYGYQVSIMTSQGVAAAIAARGSEHLE
jgi:hypothetical protein